MTTEPRLDRDRIAQALLAAIVEASDDAIISKTLDGIITSWNSGAERHFGYTAEEAVGRHVSFLIPDDRVDEEDLIIARIRRGERVDHFDTIRVRKDGRPIEVSLTISPVKDPSGEIVGASKIARDITDRKRLEEELLGYAADMSEADRRKNEFLAMLAHELRNPLAPIRNALQILRVTKGEDETGPALDMIERQVSQLVRLVDDLLDVSRIGTGKIELRNEQIDMNSVVSLAVEAARPAYETSGVDLIVSLPEQPVNLIGDPARLTQAVGNLLNNAGKFTKEGGSVRVTLETDGREAAVRVCDTGIGIAPDKISRIFEMFVQADTSLERSTGGLGIGLTLVKNLIEMHGGSVEARSEGLGLGSEFVVTMPMVTSNIAAEADEKSDVTQKEVVGKRILVVDDNVDSAESLKMLLHLSGHEVRIAHDGIDAVKVSDQFMPHVILLDIGLPRMNGYEAARVIRKRPWGAGVTMIALTGWGQKEDRERSREAGFDSHLVKPVDHVELLKLLSEPDAG